MVESKVLKKDIQHPNNDCLIKGNRMNKHIKYRLIFLVTGIFIVSGFIGSAHAMPGKIIEVSGNELTIETGSSILFENGDRIEISYMAGLLEMMIGLYEVVEVEKDRINVREISATMPPSNNMEIIVTKATKQALEEPDPAAMLPPSEDLPFIPEDEGEIFDGEVIDVMGTDVRIKLTSSGIARAGDLIDLIFQTSSGAEVPVGSWSISSINDREVIASALDTTTDPSIGMKAKIIPSQKRQINGPEITTTPSKEANKENHHVSKPERNPNDLEKQAREGDPIAQNRLGWNYQKGIGVPQDYQKAIYWYRKAADQGHLDGQKNVGWMYHQGLGVPKDMAQAAHWYEKAATQGDANAQNNLGSLYNTGNGLEKDPAQAVYWFQKAADQGNVRARNSLGWNYQKGIGVPQNYQKAVYWYKKAADQNYPRAQANMGWMYHHGLGVPKDMAQAAYWYEKAATQGDANAQNNLGSLYNTGNGLEKDPAQAVYWFQKAADQGNVRARNSLGWNYQKGIGVPQDYQKAVYWYKKAADQNYPRAQANMGWMYHQGLGVKKDLAQAVYWYEKAATQGDANAQNNLIKLGKSW